MRIPFAALVFVIGGALALSGCGSDGSAATEAQRLRAVLTDTPGVVRVDSDSTEARVGYSSEVHLVAEVRSANAASTIPKVISAWQSAAPKWNADLTTALNGDHCLLQSNSGSAEAGQDRTARFFVSLCETFPKSEVRIDLDPAGSVGAELTLDVSGDGITHVDAALVARIRALDGADAPVSRWFLAGSDDGGRFADFANRD